jgi:hypothetical protein
VGTLEVSTRPEGQAHQPGGRSTFELILRWHEGQNPLGLGHGLREVGRRQRQGRTVQRNQTAQPPKFLLICDDHLRRTVQLCSVQLRLQQALLDALLLAAHQEPASVVHVENWPAPHHRIGERLQPVEGRGLLPAAAQGGHGQFDQVRRPLVILRGQGVMDRVRR